jgi:hypothetical protein
MGLANVKPIVQSQYEGDDEELDEAEPSVT